MIERTLMSVGRSVSRLPSSMASFSASVSLASSTPITCQP